MAAPTPPTLPDMTSGSRNFITTDQDHSGIALVMCTLLATWAVLCFFVRIYMRATISGPFGTDDVLCSIATIFGLVQMVVSTAAISFGFGKSTDLLTESQILKASKAIYVAQLLYIVTNALTKCTVALLLARIIFIKSRVRACYGVLVASCLWGLGSFVAEAVRCTHHDPWQTVGAAQCSNLVITTFNILIEIVLLAFPVWLVWGLQTDISKKITVVAVFWLRFPVIIAAGLRLYFLDKTIGSDQPLFHGVVPFILLNVEMHYGLMAATMPTLKPFVSAFNTAWGTYDTQGISGYGQGSANSYAMNSLGRVSNRKNSAHTPLSSEHDTKAREAGATSISKYGKNVTQVRAAGLATAVPSGKPTLLNTDSTSDPARTLSRGSGGSSQHQMIIRRTFETEIHYEPNHPDESITSAARWNEIHGSPSMEGGDSLYSSYSKVQTG